MENKGLEDGWVAPQSSIANFGGISLEDWEKIRAIPGVEVAAPLSFIGYFDYDSINVGAKDATPGKFYEVVNKVSFFDGLKNHVYRNSSNITNMTSPELENSSLYKKWQEETQWTYPINVQPGATIRYPNEMMLVAIDPEEEEKLYTLSESLEYGMPLTDVDLENVLGTTVIPVIALYDQEYEVTEEVLVYEIDTPLEVTDEEVSGGVVNYLKNRPKNLIGSLSINSFSPEWRLKNSHILFDTTTFEEESYQVTVAPREIYRYSPLSFINKSVQENGIPVIQAETYESINHLGFELDFPFYRYIVEDYQTVEFGVQVVGAYKGKEVRPKYQESWEPGDPVDIYTPHYSMIIKNGAGEQIEPTPLIPLPAKGSYYSGAPDAITILEAAELFYKDEPPISSIRVVVEGVEERSEDSQKKIETVAKEIMDLTGHHVEIMLGSSASKVHVKLAGDRQDEAGVVEEGWQQMGVSWSIENQINQTNILLFVYLVLISLIFCFTVITYSLLRRSVEFAMLRAIGWKRISIVKGLSLEVLLLCLVSLIPIVIANLQLKAIKPFEFLLILIINLFIISVGYYIGSRKALLLSPRAGMEGEGRDSRLRRLIPIKGFISYTFNQLFRRPLRFGLMTAVLILTSFMTILFIATQQSLSDFLFLSFLGEKIDLHLQGYQQMLLMVGILLTVSVVIILQFLNITERKKEFFALRAIGWSIRRIQNYLCLEVLFMTVIGSVFGTLSAYAVLTFFSELWIPIWLVGLIILTPVLLLIIFTVVFVRTMKITGVVKDHLGA